MQQRVLPTLLATTILLTGCNVLSLSDAVGDSMGESSEAKIARERAESFALGFGVGVGGGIVSTSSVSSGPVEMVLATKTELAPYEDFVKRGLASARADSSKTPTYLVHAKPKDLSSSEYRLVKTLIQNDMLISQTSYPRFGLFDPFKTEATDRVEFLVSEPCPNLGTQISFTIKGLAATKPITFYLGDSESDGGFPQNWLTIGESTPVDGVANISVLLKEDMGVYTDGSPARFQRGHYYGLGYFAEGMSNPSLIRQCPAGCYIPR
jgi:hypothetical protein